MTPHKGEQAKIESEKAGLNMNFKKTKTMIVTKQDQNFQANIKIENKTLEQVNSFKYLPVCHISIEEKK